jgi:predicted RecA/RadA family phage recombinase
MKNHVQRGDTLTIPAPAAVLSGGVVVAGAIVGVANGDAASGAPVDVDVTGVFKLPKVSALAIAAGDVVYWDGAAGLVTKTASGNSKLGYATEAAANPSASVNVRLVPTV